MIDAMVIDAMVIDPVMTTRSDVANDFDRLRIEGKVWAYILSTTRTRRPDLRGMNLTCAVCWRREFVCACEKCAVMNERAHERLRFLNDCALLLPPVFHCYIPVPIRCPLWLHRVRI